MSDLATNVLPYYGELGSIGRDHLRQHMIGFVRALARNDTPQ